MTSTQITFVVVFAIWPVRADADADADADPERRPFLAVSAGGGSRYWAESAEHVVGLNLRIDLGRSLSLRLGEDIICSDPACWLLGFHRAGLQYRPLPGPVSPYGYGYLAFFLHAAEPIDESLEPRPYNVGLHWGAGVGAEITIGARLGVFVEAGVLGDAGRDSVVPTATAGVLVRLGRTAARPRNE